jgi:CDP-glucose 4,6-dehydratase
MPFADIYRGRRVLVTGHTGFKGSWLVEWLLDLGAEVTGLALPPSTSPSLFDQLGLSQRADHRIGDIRDAGIVAQAVATARPDFVFHLAAQAIVRLSYEQPVETYTTNLLGTLHVMEALRTTTKPCAAVFVTTDKCYENHEWIYGYREDDALGGTDPYSSSKAACELAIASWRRSFFENHPVRIASARAGNVIGGGDWARDRILPDCIRALERGESIPVRNNIATRPWQHVLEPLSGYLQLGASMYGSTSSSKDPSASTLCSAFNFGPSLISNRTVSDLVAEVLRHWPGKWEDRSEADAVHEATLLNLATDKALHCLEWHPVWTFEQAVQRTASWYRRTHEGEDPVRLTCDDISNYVSAANSAGLAWSR